MSTKQNILNEALSLFSVKDHSTVFVSEIADAVGIITLHFISIIKVSRIFLILAFSVL